MLDRGDFPFTYLLDFHPDPLRLYPLARIEEIVINLDIRDISLVQFKVEAAGGEDGGECQVELAISEATLHQNIV